MVSFIVGLISMLGFLVTMVVGGANTGLLFLGAVFMVVDIDDDVGEVRTAVALMTVLSSTMVFFVSGRVGFSNVVVEPIAVVDFLLIRLKNNRLGPMFNNIFFVKTIRFETLVYNDRAFDFIRNGTSLIRVGGTSSTTSKSV